MCENDKRWKLTARPLSELMAMGFPEKFYWGGWKLDANTLELVLVPVLENGDHLGEYRVDLERMLNAKTVLNWILHLEEKIWMTPQATKGFLRAVRTIYGHSIFTHEFTSADVRRVVDNLLRSPTTAGEWAALERLMASDFLFDKEFMSGGDGGSR